jgi:glycerate kinase
MPMRILVAPQEFKGTLTAVQAASAMRDALAGVLGSAQLDVAPLSDGGPGFVDALLNAARGEARQSLVEDPLGRPVTARWGMIGGGRTAVLEMAAASGLSLLAASERDPRRTSTFGTGELIRAALDASCEQILLGVGGSATNDGGTGAAAALGVRFYDAQEQPLSRGGAALARLERIDLIGRDPRLERVQLFVAADVNNPLCGPTGASSIYGPQKGADAQMVSELDGALARLAQVTVRQIGRDFANLAGAGAAGGLAFGMLAFCGAQLRSGFELVCHELKLEERVQRADLVLTGEGRLDRQSSYGKGPGQLAALAKRHGKRTVIFAGRVDPTFSPAESPFDEVLEVSTRQFGLDPAASTPAQLLRAAAEHWARIASGHSEITES